MPIEFTLPDLGEGIHEAEIISVKVAVKDQVKENQPLFEVETDKAMVEIPSPVTGTVEKIYVQVGQIVTVGSNMITFLPLAESTTGTPYTVTETQAKGLVSDVDKIQAQETASSDQEIALEKSVGQVNEIEVKVSAHQQDRSHISNQPIPATPATRRLARELGVELRSISGSGPAGRVLKEDVLAFAQASSTTEPFVKEPEISSATDLPDFARYGTIERIPLRSIRRQIATNMSESWSHVPHVSHMDEVDVTHLEQCLRKHNKQLALKGLHLTLTVVMLKAVVSSLKRYPQFNASLDERAGEIVIKHYYNIGVAVATERGLIVPVIRNVDKKSLSQLSMELEEITHKTREGKVELNFVQGGTFTITNIGAIGGTGMVPIVNFPEAAILGMAKATEKPVVRDGTIQIRTILPLTLTFDHRLADGAEAAYFVKHVADCLECPLPLLIEED